MNRMKKTITRNERSINYRRDDPKDLPEKTDSLICLWHELTYDMAPCSWTLKCMLMVGTAGDIAILINTSRTI